MTLFIIICAVILIVAIAKGDRMTNTTRMNRRMEPERQDRLYGRNKKEEEEDE